MKNPALNPLVILQARTSSSRLPGKVLLPIAGLPLVVLAARRGQNQGLPVWVATSHHPSDDLLCQILERHGIRSFRGPLDDVLQRFVLATAELDETAVVVRLTADNAFPDGLFLGELLSAFGRDGRPYWGTQSPADGLPYGLSAEVFTVAALREADQRTTSACEREHVTPWLRRRYPGLPFRPSQHGPDLSALRCTIDCWADYERVVRVFARSQDPIGVPWTHLCRLLAEAAPQPRVSRRPGSRDHREITLGTAQIGIPNYGRSNRVGQPLRAAAIGLIREAVERGINCVDTARAYQEAESVVGEALQPYGDQVRVVTKLAPLDDLPEDAPPAWVCQAVKASVLQSCRELRLACLPVLLLHRWRHRHSHQGVVWQQLLELKQAGAIRALGVSVASPAEAAAALADREISHVQLPFNILDHRWRTEPLPPSAPDRSEVVVHARSVFLQGILAADPDLWPRISGGEGHRIVACLEELVRRLGRSNRADLCLAFVRAQPWIHSLVIGVETRAQMEEVISLCQQPALTADEVDIAVQCLPSAPEALLNPALWPSS